MKDTSCGKYQKPITESDENKSDEDILNEIESTNNEKSKLPSYMMTILKAKDNALGDNNEPQPIDPDTEIQQRNDEMEKIVNEIENIDKQIH